MSEENKINSVTSSVDTGTSIKFIGESDSTGNNLRIEDGKLSGTIVGSVIKDFTGRVDDVTLELSNVPIDGAGGSSEVPMEWVKIGRHEAASADGFFPVDSSGKVIAFTHGITISPETLEDIVGGRKIVDVSITPTDVTNSFYLFSVDAFSLTGDGVGVELKRLGSRARNCYAFQVTGMFNGPTGFHNYDVYALCIGEPQA